VIFVDDLMSIVLQAAAILQFIHSAGF